MRPTSCRRDGAPPGLTAETAETTPVFGENAVVADQLKHFFSPAPVRRLAADIRRAHRRFPADAFVIQAARGLDALELLDRGRHIARALAAHLPAAYPDAVNVLVRSLGPEPATESRAGAGAARAAQG